MTDEPYRALRAVTYDGRRFVAVTDTGMEGAYNLVAPAPDRNTDFTRALGRALKRPAVFPLPAFMVRTLFGEMGETLLLASTRVEPSRLQETGFQFQFPDLENALSDLLV